MNDQQYEKECERVEADLRPELTAAFLATLVKAVRTGTWIADPFEIYHFAEWCFEVAGVEYPGDEDMKPLISL